MLSQASVGQSIYNQPHGYSVTAHTCYGAVSTDPTGMLFCFRCMYFRLSGHTDFMVWFYFYPKLIPKISSSSG